VARPDPFRAIPPDVLTTEQLAERLGYNEVTVRKWISDGIIPGRKLGPEWRFWWPSVVISLFWNGEDDEQPGGDPPGDGQPPTPPG
jgi:excisionase family DNA binding protein